MPAPPRGGARAPRRGVRDRCWIAKVPLPEQRAVAQTLVRFACIFACPREQLTYSCAKSGTFVRDDDITELGG
eukprot:7377615-Prymnesium_polylepis.1